MSHRQFQGKPEPRSILREAPGVVLFGAMVAVAGIVSLFGFVSSTDDEKSGDAKGHPMISIPGKPFTLPVRVPTP